MDAGFLIILVAMVAIMYLLLIRPQQAQKRRMQEMLDKLAPGDEVITIGGIYGDVVEVYDDKVVLEVAEDVLIEVTRRAISNIVPPETEQEEEQEEPTAEEPTAEELTAEEHVEEVTEPVDAATEPAAEVEERAR